MLDRLPDAVLFQIIIDELCKTDRHRPYCRCGHGRDRRTKGCKVNLGGLGKLLRCSKAVRDRILTNNYILNAALRKGGQAPGKWYKAIAIEGHTTVLRALIDKRGWRLRFTASVDILHEALANGRAGTATFMLKFLDDKFARKAELERCLPHWKLQFIAHNNVPGLLASNALGVIFDKDHINSHSWKYDVEHWKSLPYLSPDALRILERSCFSPLLSPDLTKEFTIICGHRSMLDHVSNLHGWSCRFDLATLSMRKYPDGYIMLRRLLDDGERPTLDNVLFAIRATQCIVPFEMLYEAYAQQNYVEDSEIEECIKSILISDRAAHFRYLVGKGFFRLYSKANLRDALLSRAYDCLAEFERHGITRLDPQVDVDVINWVPKLYKIESMRVHFVMRLLRLGALKCNEAVYLRAMDIDFGDILIAYLMKNDLGFPVWYSQKVERLRRVQRTMRSLITLNC